MFTRVYSSFTNEKDGLETFLTNDTAFFLIKYYVISYRLHVTNILLRKTYSLTQNSTGYKDAFLQNKKVKQLYTAHLCG